MSFTDEPGEAALDEVFEWWLEQYRASQPDGMLISQFVTRKHLMAAFAAGVAAHAAVTAAAPSRSLPPL